MPARRLLLNGSVELLQSAPSVSVVDASIPRRTDQLARSDDEATPEWVTILQHTDPKSTYWYLTATPELLGLAAERLDTAFGGQP